MAESINSYYLVCKLFLRVLGLIYLVAFASLGLQIEGLAGSQGILPFSETLAYTESQSGIERYFQLPTLFWLNSSDAVLTGTAIAGCFVSVLIILNRLSRPALIVAFVLYLSLYYAGQLFLNFQWDTLLLEAGFLAIFLNPQSRLVILLFRWLLFRLRFMSGLSKLTMNDTSWSDFTALNYYFEVQPLPNPLAWYAHQLPDWILRTGTVSTLVIELLVPFMMFLPRRWRFIAAWITIVWQVLIILTSNHNWFNFLTIALCLFLFDDQAIENVVPQRLRRFLSRSPVAEYHPRRSMRITIGALATLIVFTSSVHMWELITMQRSTGLIGAMVNVAESYRIVSKYHVFPSMKTERIELELMGSYDGRQWQRYVFKYKPGDPNSMPGIVIPHQPRLDWMMWFVTIHPKFVPWFEQFLHSLLKNSPEVTDLLAHNPFPNAPPRYIRVDAYRYTFSSVEQREQSGQWWQRDSLGPFMPMPWVARTPIYPTPGYR